jgi:DNA-binding response OmpR family regulator
MVKDTRVLIVEDEELYGMWIETALRQLGITDISMAKDGVAALASTETGPDFDLIICDWMMPNMDGVDFLKRYREKAATSMFLILTSKPGLEDAFEATQAGATNYLVKPVSVETLQQQVVSMLH